MRTKKVLIQLSLVIICVALVSGCSNGDTSFDVPPQLFSVCDCIASCVKYTSLPSAEPQAMLDFTECDEYIVYNNTDSGICSIQLQIYGSGELPPLESYEFDIERKAASGGISQQVFVLRRDSADRENDFGLQPLCCEVGVDTAEGQLIETIISETALSDDPSFVPPIWSSISIRRDDNEYKIYPDGVFVRVGNPCAVGKVGVEDYARVSMIEWEHFVQPIGDRTGCWMCEDDAVLDADAKYYVMCVQLPDAHIHLPLNDAKDFLETLYSGERSECAASTTMTDLQWDSYDNYILINEYYDEGRIDNVVAHGATVNASRHFVFSDGSISSELSTQFVYLYSPYPKVQHMTAEVLESPFPRASYICEGLCDYAAAARWIANYSDTHGEAD